MHPRPHAGTTLTTRTVPACPTDTTRPINATSTTWAGGALVRATVTRSTPAGPLVRPLATGPTVHPPGPAADLRVLAGGPVPPGGTPSPGTVQPTTRGGIRFGTRTGIGRTTRSGAASTTLADSALPMRSDPTPRDRWEAAVATRPLEAPQPLPAAFHGLARSVVGRGEPPRFTTGPATRRALRAAGALGATTGRVIHLTRPPVTHGDAAVVAHELSHTRNPVRRPRFLLASTSGMLDDDERQALSTGQATGAGIVGRLPVGNGGGLGTVTDIATRAARAAVLEATASQPGASGSAFADAAGGTSGAPFGGLGAIAGGPAAGGTHPASNATDEVTTGPGSTPAGTDQVGTGSPGRAGSLDPDQIVEIVEHRLLQEIERRGGRWAGVF
ncbi:protein of unknown function [Actinoplanes regularis]|uniref:eCIS core domain-containing protein n=2 Tax=Actinoplanes regularis TaxID=52697 RepID=A0A239FPF1_9ACTN|nr:hypothetical protein Are01nite_61490 [Actinoplanes regularis]SNS57794.1 protein of unknown function [Actinoplanes regularis]